MELRKYFNQTITELYCILFSIHSWYFMFQFFIIVSLHINRFTVKAILINISILISPQTFSPTAFLKNHQEIIQNQTNSFSNIFRIAPKPHLTNLNPNFYNLNYKQNNLYVSSIKQWLHRKLRHISTKSYQDQVIFIQIITLIYPNYDSPMRFRKRPHSSEDLTVVQIWWWPMIHCSQRVKKKCRKKNQKSARLCPVRFDTCHFRIVIFSRRFSSSRFAERAVINRTGESSRFTVIMMMRRFRIVYKIREFKMLAYIDSMLLFDRSDSKALFRRNVSLNILPLSLYCLWITMCILSEIEILYFFFRFICRYLIHDAEWQLKNIPFRETENLVFFRSFDTISRWGIITTPSSSETIESRHPCRGTSKKRWCGIVAASAPDYTTALRQASCCCCCFCCLPSCLPPSCDNNRLLQNLVSIFLSLSGSEERRRSKAEPKKSTCCKNLFEIVRESYDWRFGGCWIFVIWSFSKFNHRSSSVLFYLE